MLNLFDYLTEEDNRKIENYIFSYGIGEHGYSGNEEYLKYWANNNKKLFHLLGGKLIHKIPFKYEFSENELHSQLKRFADEDFFYELRDQIHGLELARLLTYEDANILMRFWSPNAFVEDAIDAGFKIKLPNHNKTLQIQAGMKPMRAIQKIIDYFFSENESLKAEYEKMRIKHSLILNEKTIVGNLCLSIHPLDFLTMSDNASSWQSCMSWVYAGCYRIGTVEMMNSNNVICAYIESKAPFTYGKDGHEDSWNNKKWRQLFYCTKEIIVGGKAYPFSNYDITKTIITELRKLAEQNWHHTYEYGIEEYLDMRHIGSANRMDQNKMWIRQKRTIKHNILFDTKGMYNDMFNDHEPGGTRYYCVRNKVKHNIVISYSGKAPCLCCGEQVPEYDCDYEDDYNDRYCNAGQVLCEDCQKDLACDRCHSSSYPKIVAHINGKNVCANCFQKAARVCPDCGQIYLEFDHLSPAYVPLIKLTEQYDVEKDRNSLNNLTEETTIIGYHCCQDCIDIISETGKSLSGVEFESFPGQTNRWGYANETHIITKQVYAPNDPVVLKHISSGMQIPELVPDLNS